MSLCHIYSHRLGPDIYARLLIAEKPIRLSVGEGHPLASPRCRLIYTSASIGVFLQLDTHLYDLAYIRSRTRCSGLGPVNPTAPK